MRAQTTVPKSTEPSVTESDVALYPELASYVASVLPDIQAIACARQPNPYPLNSL